MNKRHIRIHGDNIVECERTLDMLKDALGGELALIDCALWLPVYELRSEETIFMIELLSGHGRWGIDLSQCLIEHGGILREYADSYVCEVVDGMESVLFAIEYCSALPAGNNAWQRNGRALSSVLSGVPYLFITELGGVELKDNREVKSSRSPNPLVPFSYLCTTKDYSMLCLPIYRPHPSISDDLYERYIDVFGYEESLRLIKNIFNDVAIADNLSILSDKCLKLIELLSEQKRLRTCLRGKEWRMFLNSNNRSSWILRHSDLIWKKKTSSKVKATDRIRNIISKSIEMSFNTIGASEIPICLIPRKRILEFQNLLVLHYPGLRLSLPKDKPLALVWITGYKPSGEDSRPDRGLCPLVKMVMGESCRMLSIIYGPAKEHTWHTLGKGIEFLALENGLWQAIYRLCDGVLIDCTTKRYPEYIKIKRDVSISNGRLTLPYEPTSTPEYSEHDVDTAIHQILTRSGLFECLCNPPGGDWSGISYRVNGDIFRWTSLPRVSEINGKRPDHVFQLCENENNTIITIESKGLGGDLENQIGENLASYIMDLFSMVPTSVKRTDGEWRLYNKEVDLGKFSIIKAGAFLFKNDNELQRHLDRGRLDCILAFEFGSPTVLHMLSNDQGRFLENIVKETRHEISGFEIKIH